MKIPGTAEGVPAIRQMIAEGHSINVTLLFSVDRYAEVIEAYLSGLEAFVATGGDLATVSSVASFFVSRVDTEVDQRLDAIGTPEALALRGKAAVANAQLAYELFLEQFAGPRWEALAAKGARVQRPLWASTSTKNPAYPDTLYVDDADRPRHRQHHPRRHPRPVRGPRHAGAHHRRRPARRPRGARRGWRAVGVDLDDVGRVLEDEGVASFSKSFDELLGSLQTKADQLQHGN